MPDFSYLLPEPEAGYRGSKYSLWFLIALTVLTTGRSLVHIFAPDGGANSIAGIALEGEAGDNLVHIFSQWGLEQLLLAVVSWVIIARYRFLVPFALALQLADWSGRFAIGFMKPLIVDDPPPGAIANYILIPTVAIAFWFSLPARSERT